MVTTAMRETALCDSCGQSFPHVKETCPAKDVTCTKCGKKGHLPKVCLKALVQQAVNSPSQDSSENAYFTSLRAHNPLTFMTLSQPMSDDNLGLADTGCNVMVFNSPRFFDTTLRKISRSIQVQVVQLMLPLFVLPNFTYLVFPVLFLLKLTLMLMLLSRSLETNRCEDLAFSAITRW